MVKSYQRRIPIVQAVQFKGDFDIELEGITLMAFNSGTLSPYEKCVLCKKPLMNHAEISYPIVRPYIVCPEDYIVFDSEGKVWIMNEEDFKEEWQEIVNE